MANSQSARKSRKWTPEQRAQQAQRSRQRVQDRKRGTNGQLLAINAQQPVPQPVPPADEGLSGFRGGGDVRARRRLNLATLEGMQRAFDRGGYKAIEKVMKTQPGVFLKMLVLLVPRELQVEHSGSIREMSDQQIEDAITAIRQMIADRERGMIDVTPNATPDEKPAE